MGKRRLERARLPAEKRSTPRMDANLCSALSHRASASHVNSGHRKLFPPDVIFHSLQSVPPDDERSLQSVAPGAPLLQPTLWRTCRVLANRKRLHILTLLARGPAQTVSSVARSMKLSLPTASQYLRALEARGLLTCQRVGRGVEYRLTESRSEGPADQIVTALRPILGRGGNRVERLFKLATAFTHPRRVEVFRAISKGADSFDKIQTATHISDPALQRHLEKLEARHFISSRGGAYAARIPTDPFAKAVVGLVNG